MGIILKTRTAAFALILYLTCSSKQQSITILAPSPSLHLNMSATANTSVLLQATQTVQTVNFTVKVSSLVSPNRSSEAVVNSSASIISQITGDTKTQNNTFFMEFKTEAIMWNPELTKEHHNTFIKTANKIVEVIDNLYSNTSVYKGSFVIGFREGGYVSVKLKFNGGDINNLDIIIAFLRDGGGDLLTDKVYLKLGKIADCIIAYIDTTICDCLSMTYRRQITCRQPEVYGGEACPEQCYAGHVVAGSTACSWDDLDAFKCSANTAKPISIILIFTLVFTGFL